MTWVQVVRPIGEKSFPRCTADQFDLGVLTVTSVDDDSILDELQPETWLHAWVLDDASEDVRRIDNAWAAIKSVTATTNKAAHRTRAAQSAA